MTKPKRRRTTKPGEPTRARVLALHAAGKPTATIADKLGLTPTGVAYHLQRAGVDLYAEYAAGHEAAAERFVAAWNAAPTAAEAAEAVGRSLRAARNKASELRRRGLAAKYMPRRKPPRKAPLRESVTALLRRGLSNRTVATRSGASLVYVAVTRRRLGLLTLRRWTADEDALLAVLTEEQIAARTGRTVEAVRHRRKDLRRRERA
jgi:hypothetical protein